jgi:hypothetical protein
MPEVRLGAGGWEGTIPCARFTDYRLGVIEQIHEESALQHVFEHLSEFMRRAIQKVHYSTCAEKGTDAFCSSDGLHLAAWYSPTSPRRDPCLPLRLEPTRQQSPTRISMPI